MIRLASVLLLGAAVLFFGTPSKADQSEPVRLSPSSSWHAYYADDNCRLARQFGEGDQIVRLVLDRFQPGDSFLVTLSGHRLGHNETMRDVALRFGPAESEQRVSFRAAQLGGFPTMIFRGTMRIAQLTPEEEELRRSRTASSEFDVFDRAVIDPAREAAVEYLQIDVPRRPSIILETGSLGPPFNALRQCMDELLTHWEIDVDRHRSLSRHARAIQSPSRWLFDTDYPVDAARRGQQAIVHFRLIVNEQGRATGCRIQRSTQGESFKTAVCNAFMRRARFEPALDAGGNPIQSYFLSTVHFTLP